MSDANPLTGWLRALGNVPRTGFPGGISASEPEDPYTTKLPLEQEIQFRAWAKEHKVRMEPGWNEDYDMRGLWKMNPDFKPDSRGHYPDTFKKPNHPTFSNESIYATSDAPRWVGMRLIDKNGRVVADETPVKKR